MSQLVIVTNQEQLIEIVTDAVRRELGELVRDLKTSKEYMDEREAGDYLGFSANTLRMWRSEKTGPVYCKKGGVKYRRKDLDDWMASNRVMTSDALEIRHARYAS